jgi:hypothetical protein
MTNIFSTGFLSSTFPFSQPLLVVVLVWSLFWKGRALWKSAKNNQKYWFIAILIVNTVGMLEIIYISFFQKKLTPTKSK